VCDLWLLLVNKTLGCVTPTSVIFCVLILLREITVHLAVEYLLLWPRDFHRHYRCIRHKVVSGYNFGVGGRETRFIHQQIMEITKAVTLMVSYTVGVKT